MLAVLLFHSPRFSYMTEADFYGVVKKATRFHQMPPGCLGADCKVSVALAEARQTLVHSFKSVQYPVALVTESNTKRFGVLHIVYYGEYIFAIWLLDDKPMNFGPSQLPDVLERLQFLQEAKFFKPVQAKVGVEEIPVEEVFIQKGEVVEVSVAGTWRTMQFSKHESERTAEASQGYAFRENKEAFKPGSLLCRVGDEKTGLWVEIGRREFVFTVPAPGALTFLLNDADAQGNAGVLTVTIRHYFPKLLGVQGKDVAKDECVSLGIAAGVVIAEVAPNSPAAVAGLQPGDILTRIHRYDIKNMASVDRAIAFVPPGDRVSVRLIRNHVPQEISVTVAQLPWGD
jgi:hypothetical protein